MAMQSLIPAPKSPAQDRPVRLRMRPDLELRPVMSKGNWRWNVRDPVSLRHFQLEEAEYLVLRSLDGKRGLGQIQAEVEHAFAPRRLALPHLQSFLAMLHREGLAVADAPGQGPQLLKRQAEQRRRRFWATCGNPLAIRLGGVDPTRVLDWLYPKCRWIFTGWVLLLGLMFVCSVGLFLITQASTVAARLPDLRELTAAGNVLLFAAILILAKSLHELGHALTCRHFGGHCHEMGIMLLVFTPCLYSNVSHAWMIPEKWRRIAISSAGIVVELVLAAACGLLWWFSEPGYFNTLCLYVMLICSVSTLLLNANPLLRFDGYYILSDWLEIPNLGQRSTTILRQRLLQWFAGVDPRDDAPKDRAGQRGLMVYAILSIGYRLVLTVGILWFLYQTLEPRGLGLVGQLLAGIVLANMLFRPAADAWSFLHDPIRSGNVNWRRLLLVSVALVAAVIAVGSIPLPRRVTASATVEPKNARDVFIAVAGVLRTTVLPGQRVDREQKLAELSNPALEMEVARLDQRCEEQRLLVELLTRQQIGDTAAANDLPTAREVLTDLEKLRDQLREDHQRLTILAPQSGMVFAAARQSAGASVDATSVAADKLLDASNVGATLDVGTKLCVVGDAEHWVAIAVVDEASIPLVRAGQSARVQLDALPGAVLTGVVRQVAEVEIGEDARRSPEEQSQTGTQDRPGRLVRTRYQAQIDLDAPPATLRLGAIGTAKIDVEPTSLGRRLFETVRQTFSIGK
jgi:putative peptide zinc metalloprotease protein